jgi:hypothetical protein
LSPTTSPAIESPKPRSSAKAALGEDDATTLVSAARASIVRRIRGEIQHPGPYTQGKQV